MANIDDEIRSKIEAFANDIAAIVRHIALEAVSSALGTPKLATPQGAAAPARKARTAPAARAKAAPAKKAAKPGARVASSGPPTRPATAMSRSSAATAASVAKKAPARASGAKRPPAELAKLVERLAEYIKANPGLRMEAIGKAIGRPTRELNLPIKKLLAAKRARSEGHKRATEYYPA